MHRLFKILDDIHRPVIAGSSEDMSHCQHTVVVRCLVWGPRTLLLHVTEARRHVSWPWSKFCIRENRIPPTSPTATPLPPSSNLLLWVTHSGCVCVVFFFNGSTQVQSSMTDPAALHSGKKAAWVHSKRLIKVHSLSNAKSLLSAYPLSVMEDSLSVLTPHSYESIDVLTGTLFSNRKKHIMVRRDNVRACTHTNTQYRHKMQSSHFPASDNAHSYKLASDNPRSHTLTNICWYVLGVVWLM